jgi:hypothetical protein
MNFRPLSIFVLKHPLCNPFKAIQMKKLILFLTICLCINAFFCLISCNRFESITINGTCKITDGDGKPLSNVELVLHQLSYSGGKPYNQSARPQSDVAKEKARTNSNGEATFKFCYTFTDSPYYDEFAIVPTIDTFSVKTMNRFVLEQVATKQNATIAIDQLKPFKIRLIRTGGDSALISLNVEHKKSEPDGIVFLKWSKLVKGTFDTTFTVNAFNKAAFTVAGFAKSPLSNVAYSGQSNLVSPQLFKDSVYTIRLF